MLQVQPVMEHEIKKWDPKTDPCKTPIWKYAIKFYG